jgi:hypothetical protein
MAFMSLILKDKANRWTNIILGLVYTGLCVLDLIGSVIYGISISGYDFLMYFSHIVASALIVWYAYQIK